jgi:hypothetical protein
VRIVESSIRLGNTPTALNLNRITFYINFLKSKLLHFSSTIQTSNKINGSTYTLVELGGSYTYINVHFICILGLVSKIIGIIIINTLSSKSVVVSDY